MDLTVVVCTYNRAASLGLTMESLAQQAVTVDVSWEVIVVDNNSSDNTAEVIRTRTRDFPTSLRYVFESRQGVSHARNTGITSAAGEFIAFTDDDVQPEANWVANIITGLRTWNADVIGGQILPRWETEPPRWLKHNHALLDLLALTGFNEARFITSPMIGHPQIWGANMAFRRAFFQQAGLFDTSRGPIGAKSYHGDDVDMIRRGLEQGLKAVFDPALKVWHHVPAQRMRRAYFRMRTFYPGEAAGLRYEGASRIEIFGIPGWAFRFLLTSCGCWLRALMSRSSDAFTKELELIERLGFILGCARRRKSRIRGFRTSRKAELPNDCIVDDE